MIVTTLTIKDEIGFHARTAALFAKSAAQFSASISVTFNNKKVNAKSTLSLMTLGVKSQDKITLEIVGQDENEAHSTLTEMINSNFKS